jgi:hypothetical protein
MATAHRQVLTLALLCLFFLNSFAAGTPIKRDTTQKYLQASPFNPIEDIHGFEIEAKYSYIRSYPGGGGIFLLNLNPDHTTEGCVILHITEDSHLQPQLSTRILHNNAHIAELTITPKEHIYLGIHEITVNAVHIKMPILSTLLILLNSIISNHVDHLYTLITNLYTHTSFPSILCESKTLVLEVEIYQWSSGNLPDAIIKRDEFITWLNSEHPEYGHFQENFMFAYMTYPEIFIVEHWTFLYKNWEMRICYHVMIPPHDWSQLCLRKRGEFESCLASIRKSNGTISEIPIDDYPIMFGY